MPIAIFLECGAGRIRIVLSLFLFTFVIRSLCTVRLLQYYGIARTPVQYYALDVLGS